MPEASCSCPQCGARYRAEGLRPGRRLRCRKCRTVFTYQGMAEVASPAGAAEAALPAAMGDKSSLMRAGMEGSIPTLKPSDSSRALKPGEPAAPADPERYAVEEEIARGGMGQILRAADRDLGREVAMKVMLEGMDEKARSRFVEEAQVTAQLEHPNIVPVHELGIDSEGKLFFTMKMVKGKSLSEVIRELKEGKKDDYTLGRLLNAFVNICNAMAFAHSKGVIHRDLKPANIMLGDFGEVLVMDWGLSKVMGREEAPAPAPSPPQTTPVTPKTSRFQAGGERTQDGAILGTPFYMPPEQARGHIGELDRRSDIYSLGAILYEILTLKPPVEGENLQEILIKVAKGEIKPPEERTPDRPIPRELSAIAMKALSRKPEARYPNVEDLRRDIELYLEGRAVSAKPDTAWETFVKLVKRHKSASVTTAAALAVIAVLTGIGYGLNLQERRKAVQALADFRAEKEAKENAEAARRQERRKSTPAFVQAARSALSNRRFDEAMIQAEIALEYDPGNAEARLIRAQILIWRNEYPKAASELETYLKLKPDDRNAKDLLTLVERAKPGDAAYAAAFADLFLRQGAFYFAETLAKDNQTLLAAYKRRLSAAWPGTGNEGGLGIDQSGGLGLNLHGKRVADLLPLKGIPLTWLNIGNCDQVSVLTPLQGMPLTSLILAGCRQVRDLAPLQGMPLTSLDLFEIPVSDLTPLQGMPLTSLNLEGCRQIVDLMPLKGMPLNRINLRSTPISDLTPLKGMELREVFIDPKHITKGLEILRQMKSLKSIGLSRDRMWAPDEFWRRYDAGEFK